MVGRRCVPFGGRGGVRIGGGCMYQTTACVCLTTGGVPLSVVEVAVAVGWRMSSWFGDTGVLLVLAGLLDYCRSVSDRLEVYLVWEAGVSDVSGCGRSLYCMFYLHNWCKNSTGCDPVFLAYGAALLCSSAGGGRECTEAVGVTSGHKHSGCILLGGTSLDVSPACRCHSPSALLLNVPGQVAAFWEINLKKTLSLCTTTRLHRRITMCPNSMALHVV